MARKPRKADQPEDVDVATGAPAPEAATTKPAHEARADSLRGRGPAYADHVAMMEAIGEKPRR